MTYQIDGFPGREIEINQIKYLYFGGTSYLGLQEDPAFQDIYIANIRKYGTHYGASRKSNIRLSIYEEVEQLLSNLVGSESCITLSSGYLAAQLVRQSLGTGNNIPFYAPNTHSALYTPTESDTQNKPYASFSALNIALREQLKKDKETTAVVFMDAIDFSGSNYPNFEGLKILPLQKIVLVVDDSHGIGLVGDQGGGVFKTVQTLNPKELIVCCSLGKGFAIQGGAIMGTKKRVEQLSNTAFFGGASPAAPAAMACITDGLKLFGKKRKVLKENIEFFRACIKPIDKFISLAEHPAFSFQDESLSRYLEQHKVLVTNFRYPSEESPIMSRIVLSAHHRKEDIYLLCNLISNYYKKNGHL
ncbi:pyridoxal phosphate-dependent aminotransferase family protein [Arenibacter aquaticus]|uniref:Pyridoxal phosphate-dependent aminotransferase family protein n=1 Tax=Arenibacter aquaticus TaxID=2489054 RepID=A0A430K088_9FLAO|nr:aminotransferase class I/II-fold pyridoxal phosphate-dependent enzyme [Arenibacter aquaticus]RTE52351.1 pyridoxal phosphate-dependent aminotransferase family protein [Arenibacter aquaticus]